MYARTPADAKLHDLLSAIAREHTPFATLSQLGIDRLDFREVGVVALRQALEAAYRAGLDARPKRKPTNKKNR